MKTTERIVTMLRVFVLNYWRAEKNALFENSVVLCAFTVGFRKLKMFGASLVNIVRHLNFVPSRLMQPHESITFMLQVCSYY